jgi:Secretion system C-terminal sorting domain
MKKIISTLLFLFQFTFLLAQNYNGPESVEFDSAHNRYLISNTGSHQIIALQNGTKSIFATLTGTGPHGLEIVGDTLYCCNGASIRALSLTTGALIYSKNLNAGFLNGITHDPLGNLYITDFSAKKVYRLNTLTRKFNVFVTATVTTPNGIIYDAFDGVTPRLVFCNWGANASIKKINLSDSTISTLTSTSLSNLDGICKGKNGKFYVSSWGNQTIQRFDSTFTGGSVAVVTGLSNPADIVYNLSNDTLGVPNASNNTVSFHNLATTNSIHQGSYSSQLLVYPNPTHGSITITNGNSFIHKITVYNYLLQEIMQQVYNNEKSIELQLSANQRGSYFIRVNDEKALKAVTVN